MVAQVDGRSRLAREEKDERATVYICLIPGPESRTESRPAAAHEAFLRTTAQRGCPTLAFPASCEDLSWDPKRTIRGGVLVSCSRLVL